MRTKEIQLLTVSGYDASPKFNKPLKTGRKIISNKSVEILINYPFSKDIFFTMKKQTNVTYDDVFRSVRNAFRRYAHLHYAPHEWGDYVIECLLVTKSRYSTLIEVVIGS